LASLPLLLSEFESEALIGGLLRWFHVISGITWIGLLYFFNLVNVPTQGKLDGPTKKAVNPELQPRALWWFRWGAMYTLLFGLLLFWWKYMRGSNMRDADGAMSGRALWIMVGMTMGIYMWFNVWFMIWPRQQVILRATKEGTKPPEGMPEKAKLFSRINFVLSGPMLGCMVAANNTIAWSGASIAIVFAVSLVVIHLMLRLSAKAGSSI